MVDMSVKQAGKNNGGATLEKPRLRKDVDLDWGTLDLLLIGALEDKRKLKNYMEQVLIDRSLEIKKEQEKKTNSKK
jgi:hypothetical protein